MNTITVYKLGLQFHHDDEDVTKEQVLEAVEIINLSLQREPYGLGAQLFVDYDNLDYDQFYENDLEE